MNPENTEWREQIGQRLRACRIDKGLTYREVGERLGTATSRISNYEHGYRAMTIEELKILADFYDQDPCYLAGYETQGQVIKKTHFIHPERKQFSINGHTHKLGNFSSDDIGFTENTLKKMGAVNAIHLFKMDDIEAPEEFSNIDYILINSKSITPTRRRPYALIVNGHVKICYISPNIIGTGKYTIEMPGKQTQDISHKDLEKIDILGEVVGKIDFTTSKP